MQKILLILLLSFFFQYQTQAQNNEDGVSIMLSSDLLYADLYYLQQLHVSSNTNVNLSGSVTSETSVLILPKKTCGITILPIPENGYNAQSDTAARDKKGGTTVIKMKGTGVGRPAPQAIIYPNPVQTILTFDTPNNLTIGTSVFDTNGILKLSSSFKSTNTGTINVSNLTTGTYILKLDFIDSQSMTVQFIKY